MKTIILIGCILGVASGSAAAAPVIIQGHRPVAEELTTERVSYADLDISSEAGLGTLKGRIHAAANRVCASNQSEPLQASLESLGCYRRAMTDSMAQLDRVLAARSSGAAIAAATITVSAH
jgi:UrcA family protein